MNPIKLVKYLGILGVSSLPIHAFAEKEFSIVPSLAYQSKTLTFDQEYTYEGESLNTAEFSAELPVLSSSLTLAYDRFFASLKYETTAAATSTTTDETDRSIDNGIVANLITTSGSSVDVERDDLSLTFGYRVWKSLNLFVGYLEGKTTLTPDAFCANPTSQVGVPDCRSVNRAFQQYFAGRFGGYQQEAYRQDYTESGNFIGVSYGVPVGEVGTFSFSYARARMDGEYSDNANDRDNLWANPPLDQDATSTLLRFNYKGTTEGESLGVTWTGSLGDFSSYFADVRYQRYEMDGVDATGAETLQGISLNTVEEIFGLSLGVKLFF